MAISFSHAYFNYLLNMEEKISRCSLLVHNTLFTFTKYDVYEKNSLVPWFIQESHF